MSRTWRNPMGPGDEEGRDMELASILVVVDPAKADPNYWLRFQSWVMEAAAPELARRRLMADLTVGEVMTGWARAVVPTALLAAAVAALIFVQASSSGKEQAVAASVEELLVAGMERETIPEALDAGEAEASVAFAAERF